MKRLSVERVRADLEEVAKKCRVAGEGYEHDRDSFPQKFFGKAGLEFGYNDVVSECYGVAHSALAFVSYLQEMKKFGPEQKGEMRGEPLDFWSQTISVRSQVPDFSQDHWKRILEFLEEEGIPKGMAESKRNWILRNILTLVVDEDYSIFWKGKGFDRGYGRHFGVGEFESARDIRPCYDVGVAIARGGLYASYLFHLADLPIMDVEMKRKGHGASFVPHENFDGSMLRGKNVLILENDVSTGGTLRRATRELLLYDPASLDVCFMEGKISCDYSKIPVEIGNVYHIGNEGDFERENETLDFLAQRFDDEYHIFARGAL